MPTYYVSTVDGNDSYNGLYPTYQSELDGPWLTVTKVNNTYASFVAGDSILFNRGNSWSDAYLRIRSSGSAAGGYITFGAYGTGAKPIIIFNGAGGYSTVFCYVVDIQYVHIDNLDVRGVVESASSGGINFSRDNCNHIWISNCDVNTFGSGAVGIMVSKIDTYIIEYCTVVNAPQCGIAVYGSTTYLICNGLVQYNDVSGTVASDNITIHSCSPYGPGYYPGNNHVFQYNKVYNGGEDGFDTEGANGGMTGLVFRGNETYGNNNIGLSIGGTGSIYEFNWIHDEGKHGLYLSNSATNCEVRYNIVSNCVQRAFITATSASSPSGNHIYNNVFREGASATTDLIYFATQSTPTGNVFKNNIIWAETYHGVAYAGTNTPTSTNSVWDYNCFYDSGGDTTFFDVGGAHYTFTTWKSTWSQDANSMFDNPDFVNAGGSYALDTDFKIQSISPCRDVGIDVGLTEDYFGNAVGATPDIGVHEYTQGITTHITLRLAGI